MSPRGAALPARVAIHEVGPRDGLQNEERTLSAEDRLRLIALLASAGLRRIEIGSFVRPDWIPQMAGTDQLARRLPELGLPAEVCCSALVPNRTGLQRAAEAGMRDVAVFLSASETHNQKNTNKSIAASLEEFGELLPDALARGMRVRGYVSVVWGCPYEGKVDPRRALEVADRLRALGCAEISLGDTIGVGNPKQTREIVELFFSGAPVAGGGGGSGLAPFTPQQIALHLHDTHGTALANCLAGLELGATIFDTAVGGTGGCPYAPGAPGNLATEDLVSMFGDMGIDTGVDLDKLIEAGLFVQERLGHKLTSRRLQAALGRREKAEARPAGST